MTEQSHSLAKNISRAQTEEDVRRSGSDAGYPPGGECAQCGGRCCKEHGCVLSPEDLLRALAGKEPDEKSLPALLRDEKKGLYAIEYLSTPQGVCFYLRMRHKCYTFIGVDAMGECIALGADGCLLPEAERPKGGRMLKSSPDRQCIQYYTAEQMCADWQPYQELLGSIYREWHARMTEDGTFDRCDETYFSWLREKGTGRK